MASRNDGDRPGDASPSGQGVSSDAGTAGYRDGDTSGESGTAGYRDGDTSGESGTAGYRPPERPSEDSEGASAARPRLTSEDLWNPPPDDGRPLHERLGFDDMGEFLRAIDELNQPLGSPRRPVMPPASTQRASEYHQVGVKLSLPDHERLQRIARGLGLPPTTLARVIVVRAVRAASED